MFLMSWYVCVNELWFSVKPGVCIHVGSYKKDSGSSSSGSSGKRDGSSSKERGRDRDGWRNRDGGDGKEERGDRGSEYIYTSPYSIPSSLSLSLRPPPLSALSLCYSSPSRAERYISRNF